MSNIYRNLCTELIASGDMKTLAQYRVKREYFPKEDRPIFDFIMRHREKHNVMPTVEIVTKMVDRSYDGEATGQPLSVWCEQVINKQRLDTAVNALEDATKLLEKNKDVGAWLARLEKARQVIMGDLTESTDILIDSKEREASILERYEERTLTQGVAGIELPWEYLSGETGGLQSGDITVISADTGVGKTWLLLFIAINAWLKGEKILFISREMHGDVIEDRFHSYQGKIPYKLFRHGKLEECQVDLLKAAIKAVCEQDSHRFVVVEDVSNSKGGMMEIEAKISEYRPTLVCIDGIYLVADDSGGEDLDWKSVGRVITAFKRVCKRYGIPGVVTTQNKDLSSQQNKKGKSGSSHNSTNVVAYTKEISRIATLMINMYQSVEDKANKVMRLFLPKVREGEQLSVLVNWDFETMTFTMADGAQASISDAVGVPSAQTDDSAAWPDDDVQFNVD